MSDKLPEWPEKPHDVYGTSHDWLNYHALVSYAALARMEALVEVVRGLLDQQAYPDETFNAYIDELLAACERRSER